MFGRDEEIATIVALVDDVSATSRTFVVEGPAGIGKSSLLGVVVDHARHAGCAVRSARPTMAESTIAFSVLSDLLRGVDLRMLAEPQRHSIDVALGRRRPSGPAPTTAELGRAVLQLLDDRTPEARSLVVVVDDLQWSDSASRELIEFVGRRLPERGVLLLAGQRTDDEHPLPLPEAPRVTLAPLEDAAVELIVRGALPAHIGDSTVRRLVAAAAGNPLFATELARSVGDSPLRPGRPVPLPSSLSSAVADRLLPLPRPTVEALAAVALLARPTIRALHDVGLLAELRAAEAAGILRVEGNGLAFTHPLLASAAHDAVSAFARIELHARLAHVTAGIERCVHLAFGSVQPDAGVAADLAAAASDLVARGAPSEAAELATLALDVTPATDDDRWGRMILAADALFRCGRTSDAVAHLDAALGAGERGLRCRALLALAKIEYERSDDSDTAANLAREALELADDDELRADAHTILAFVTYHDFVEAAEHAAEALTLIERRTDPDPARLASALNAAATARFFAGDGLDRAAFERAIELERGLPIPAADSAFAAMAALLKYADELVEAESMLGEVARGADPGSLPYALGHLVQVYLWSGRWNEADECARHHLAIAEQTGQDAQATMARFNMAMVAAFHGDVAAAKELGVRLVADGREHDVPWTERNGAALLGFVAMNTNDAPRAVEMFSRYDHLGEEMRLREPGYYRFHGDYIEALVATGQTSTAHEVLARLSAHSLRTGRLSGLAAAHRSRALLAATDGNRDAAFAGARQAVDLLAGTPLVFEHAKALLTEGVIARRFKDRGAGRRALGGALAAFERMGAASLAERARRELARVVGRSATGGHGRMGLTATEQRVAERAAAGDTTRQIASTLFISTKTVEANLTRIYRKLGIANRAQLATLLTGSEWAASTSADA